MEIGNAEISAKVLGDIIARFERSDDVWSKEFLSSIVIQSHHGLPLLPPHLKKFLAQWGNQKVYYNHVLETLEGYPEGPYLLKQGKLYPAYRLYPDTTGSFIVATVPTHDPVQ